MILGDLRGVAILLSLEFFSSLGKCPPQVYPFLSECQALPTPCALMAEGQEGQVHGQEGFRGLGTRIAASRSRRGDIPPASPWLLAQSGLGTQSVLHKYIHSRIFSPFVRKCLEI